MFFTRPPLPPPKVTSSVQITSDGQQKSRVITDGSRLYFAKADGGCIKCRRQEEKRLPCRRLPRVFFLPMSRTTDPSSS
jgi:hypothetical protein